MISEWPGRAVDAGHGGKCGDRDRPADGDQRLPKPVAAAGSGEFERALNSKNGKSTLSNTGEI